MRQGQNLYVGVWVCACDWVVRALPSTAGGARGIRNAPGKARAQDLVRVLPYLVRSP